MRKLFRPERRLGYRILRWVLITAFTVGIAIGTIQTLIDFHTVSNEMDQRAGQTPGSGARSGHPGGLQY